MLKNIKWDIIKGEFERVKGEMSISVEEPISLNITPKHGDTVTRKIRFGQFLEAMWRLYDSDREITKVLATQAKDGSAFFTYATPSSVDERKPISGQGLVVLGFNKLTQQAKELHINLLLTQILEDQSCKQNSSIPPNGNL